MHRMRGVHGYWYYDWADHYERIALHRHGHSMSSRPRPPEPTYDYRAGQRWQVVNVLDELDEPGEWYLDRAAGMLYFWPPVPDCFRRCGGLAAGYAAGAH